MSVDAFTLPFTTGGLPLHVNPNPNAQQAAAAPPPTAAKKKRNLPGTPDPDAEVIALSPKTLMATNRFVCEICSKGFQRDQNLQLHRRGHNLPWKLRQRSGNQPRKRVYVCPESSCIHHDPSRALGDLTGIKKHFSRKHGEKRWKCERCSKRYAVQSDWKAHSKTCGSREYKCDCGTIFSRKDSFITHRAFCDALIRDAAVDAYDAPAMDNNHGDAWRPSNPEFFDVGLPELLQMPPSITPWPVISGDEGRKGGGVAEGLASLYSSNPGDRSATPVAIHLSATALLQKAAQMGATTSSNTSSSSFLVGLLSSSPSFHPRENQFQRLAADRAASESYHTFGLTSNKMIVGVIDNVSGPMAAMPMNSAANASGEKVDIGFTRDFLGLGGNGPARAPARFPPAGSAMELVSSAYLGGIGGH